MTWLALLRCAQAREVVNPADLATFLGTATAGEVITFSTTTFPAGSVTSLPLSAALPTVTAAGVVIRGGGRVSLDCQAAMTTGNGLTLAADAVRVEDLRTEQTPRTGHPRWTSMPVVRREWFDNPRRRGVYHYVVYIHQYDGNNRAGKGEFFGDEANVALDRSRLPPGVGQHGGFAHHNLVQAPSEVDPQDFDWKTLMHEEGHNLGLGHDGTASGGNRMVTYLSVMNYRNGTLIDARTSLQAYDYGHGLLAWDFLADTDRPVDRVAGFTEDEGMYDPEGGGLEHLYFAKWNCPPGSAQKHGDGAPHRPSVAAGGTLAASDVRVDWDCSGRAGGTTLLFHDLGGGNDEHLDSDDWAGLRFDFQRSWDHFAVMGGPQSNYGEDEATIDELLDAGELVTPFLPRRAAMPGCAGTPQLPRGTNGSLRVPVVLYGMPYQEAVDLVDVRLRGAAPQAAIEADVDGDGLLDLWLEYRAMDLGLTSTTNVVGVEGTGPTNQHVGGPFQVTTLAPGAVDSDGDGLHNACDACPYESGAAVPSGTTYTSATRGPDGCIGL